MRLGFVSGISMVAAFVAVAAVVVDCAATDFTTAPLGDGGAGSLDGTLKADGAAADAGHDGGKTLHVCSHQSDCARGICCILDGIGACLTPLECQTAMRIASGSGSGSSAGSSQAQASGASSSGQASSGVSIGPSSSGISTGPASSSAVGSVTGVTGTGHSSHPHSSGSVVMLSSNQASTASLSGSSGCSLSAAQVCSNYAGTNPETSFGCVPVTECGTTTKCVCPGANCYVCTACDPSGPACTGGGIESCCNAGTSHLCAPVAICPIGCDADKPSDQSGCTSLLQCCRLQTGIGDGVCLDKAHTCPTPAPAATGA
jgi:hypothetical protein